MFHFQKPQGISTSSKLILVRFFIALGLAAIETVWIVYMDSFGLSESTIGFISTFFVLVAFLTALLATPILEKNHHKSTIIYSLLAYAFTFALIGIFRNLVLFIILASIITVVNVFRRAGFDIFFRDAVKTKDLNKKEGLLYALLNIGWLIGPLIAGFILLQFNDSAVFIAGSWIMILGVILLVLFNLKEKVKRRKELDTHYLQNLKDFIKNKKMRLPYLMVAGIEFWWALIYIYIPLFMIKSGFHGGHVGLFLTAIVVPLVLFEFQAGKLLTKFGFRKMFFFGFSGLLLVTIAAFFINSMMIILILMAVASIFMSMIEPIQDTFFFKQVTSKEEEKYYPFFGTAKNTGSFFGKLLIAVTILFLDNVFAYLTVAIVLAIIVLNSLKIKKHLK